MLKVGIVGLPNVGKSTLFKTLTKKQVDCANFPFCTIDPNIGVVEVPDERLATLAQRSSSKKIIPTAIEFVDIAGLVRGAHRGEGLGNQFLANIREVDMILHVVRVFDDADVAHVEGGVDPRRDVETIETELALADLTTAEKRLVGLQETSKSGRTRDLEKQLALMERVVAALRAGQMVHGLSFTKDETAFIKELMLLTAKPILYILNVSESEAAKKEISLPLGPNRPSLPLSVKMESEIVDLPPEDARMFLAELGLDRSGLDRVITDCYERLDLLTFFTSGEKETRAWTVKKGTKAPQAAGVIHSDFEHGFIRAEIIVWRDFVTLGEAGAKEAGKMRVEGKEYVMRDGDVAYFRVAV